MSKAGVGVGAPAYFAGPHHHARQVFCIFLERMCLLPIFSLKCLCLCFVSCYLNILTLYRLILIGLTINILFVLTLRSAFLKLVIVKISGLFDFAVVVEQLRSSPFFCALPHFWGRVLFCIRKHRLLPSLVCIKQCICIPKYL